MGEGVDLKDLEVQRVMKWRIRVSFGDRIKEIVKTEREREQVEQVLMIGPPHQLSSTRVAPPRPVYLLPL